MFPVKQALLLFFTYHLLRYSIDSWFNYVLMLVTLNDTSPLLTYFKN